MSHHPVNELRAALSQVEPYPNGMMLPPGFIEGVAFFPGGAGLLAACAGHAFPEIKPGGIMVVGNDFDSLAGFERSLRKGTERLTGPTWKNLLDLLTNAGIQPAEVFFTNAYMGVRLGRSVGPSPALLDAPFVSRCEAFFNLQVEVIAPRAIFTLGLHAARFLGRLSPQLENWQQAASFRDIDKGIGPLVRDVRLTALTDREVLVASLTHPSFRKLNVGLRRFSGLEGDAAEAELVKQASGILS